ncbi:MAG: hypothetical protein Unbinned4811contig1001_2 [Prokaryotic dsDNA virus sp.]|nr:MAG: hypothetical protein Unbinned4811contig1001_2 [Prokaryotic dsDNA virus sp.]
MYIKLGLFPSQGGKVGFIPIKMGKRDLVLFWVGPIRDRDRKSAKPNHWSD